MPPKDPFKFEDPLKGKKHSVAGQRHSKHAGRHPHEILGVLAPDAAPQPVNTGPDMDPEAPTPIPEKPVSDILATALPAKESYDEASLVAQSAFKPSYVAPPSVTGVINGQPGPLAPGQTPAPVIQAQPQPVIQYRTGTGAKIAIILMAIIIVMLCITLAIVLVIGQS